MEKEKFLKENSEAYGRGNICYNRNDKSIRIMRDLSKYNKIFTERGSREFYLRNWQDLLPL